MTVAGALARPLPVAEVIGQARFFSSLTRAQRARVASFAKTREYAGRSDIYRLGDPAVSCYVLVRGMVRFTVPLGNRSATAGEIFRSGELFGWAALIRSKQHRMGTASCVSDCSVVEVDGDALLGLMDQDHSLGYALMSRVTLLMTSTITAIVTG